MKKITYTLTALILSAALIAQSFNTFPVTTQKPPLHGRHWMAITGKPLAATVDFFKQKGMKYPPQYGALAAVTPGTPGGLLVMLAEYGTRSLKEVLAPAIQMAQGYPIEAQAANSIEREKERIKTWPYSAKVFLTHPGEGREAPLPGEIFRQKDLELTLQKLVDAEQEALSKGLSRKEAIYAAYNRFYQGDIADEFVRGCREQGGLITKEDLAKWKVLIEEPLTVNYRGIDVYKLQQWTQGPVMLQMLNMLENYDLKSMGYNSARYIHTLYQVMNLAFADRDFYYGDPYFPPAEPMQGLLSKAYAKQRIKLINDDSNNPDAGPGDPYPFECGTNPFLHLLKNQPGKTAVITDDAKFQRDFTAGTTTVVAADAEGWVVSMTPSGGWIPACIAGNTGIGMSQRMQSFVLDAHENPFNVPEPGKRPRVTLTPSLAMKDGKPLLAFAKQAGDEQDQLLLQFFLNMVEFNMTVQEATEAPSFISNQMYSSFGDHDKKPGALILNAQMPAWVRNDLLRKNYQITYRERTSGPINAIWFDRKHGSFWGGSSNHGEDYGIGW